METVRTLSEVNRKTSAAISRFSVWVFGGTCAASVLFVSQYDSLRALTDPGSLTLSVILCLCSLAFGLAQKIVSMRIAKHSRLEMQGCQGLIELKKGNRKPSEATLLHLFDLQILLTAFQAALILCVVLLLCTGMAITLYTA